jgi:uncharacterized protein YukE
MAKNFDELFALLKPSIVEINEKYNIQKGIIEKLNEETTKLLEKFEGDGSVISKLEKLNETLDKVNETFTDFDKELKDNKENFVSFSDALKKNSDEFNSVMERFSFKMGGVSDNFNNLSNASIRGANSFNEMTTRVNTVNVAYQSITKTTKDLITSTKGLETRFKGLDPKGEKTKDGSSGSGLVDAKKSIGVKILEKGLQFIAGAGKYAWKAMNDLEEAIRPLNSQMQLNSQNLTNYTVSIGRASETTELFGKSSKDLGEIQSKIFTEMGRTQIMTSEEIIKTAAMAKLVGNEGAAKFVSDMDKIGASASTSHKYFEKIRNITGKAGVDLVKATSLVQDNIQKAQSYGFKNGVESLSRMAVKSLQLRMNMEQVFKFADKNRTLEGAITSGAQLQVLGGNFSQFANPLENMYNAHYDQEANMERMINMGLDRMHFDEKTGTMAFNSMPDRELSRAAATAMGVDFEDMIASWSRAGITKRIERDYDPSGSGRIGRFDKEESDVIKSKANWSDLGNGKMGWGVSVYDAEQRKMVTKGIDSLTPDDLKSVQATTETTLIDLSKSTMSIKQRLDGWDNSMKAGAAQNMENLVGEKARGIIDSVENWGSKLDEGNNTSWRIFKEWGGMFIAGVASIIGAITIARITKGIRNRGGRTRGGRTRGGDRGGARSGDSGGARSSTYRDPKTGRFAKKPSFLKGIGKNALKAGKTALKMGKGAGVLAGVFAAGAEAIDQYQQGNFKSGSGKQGKAIGSTAGAGVGGGLGAWGGAAAGAAIGSVVPVVGTAIGALAGAVIGGIAGSKFGKTIGNTIGDYFDKGGGKAFADASKKVWGVVSKTSKKAFNVIVAPYKKTFEIISKVGSKAWDKIKEKGKVFGEIGGKIWDNLKVKGAQYGGIWTSLFKGDLKGAAVNASLLTKGVVSDVVKIGKGAWGVIKNTWEGISEFGKFIGESFSKLFSLAWWREKMDAIVGAFTPIFGWFTETGTNIKNFFVKAFDNITSFDWWIGLGKRIVDGITSGLSGICDWIDKNLNPVTWFKNGWDWIKNAYDDVSSTVAQADHTNQVYKDGQLTKVNDMIKTPQGRIYTDPKDVMMAVKPGGSLSQFFTNSFAQIGNNMGGYGSGSLKIEPININITGSIRLEGTNQSINIDGMANNRQFVNTLTQVISEGINRNMNTGRVNNSGSLQFGKFNRGMF